MLLIDLIIIGWTFTIPKGRRTFHHMAVWILTTSAIAYFLMASGLGETAIRTEFRGGGRTRSIWYVRYIMWFITTPLLLLELLFITALPLSDVASTIFFGLVFVVAALIGALIASSYKWGMFAFSVASGLYVVFMLLGPGRQSAGVLGIDYKKTFLISAAYLSFLSMLYPICWGLSDGGNRISPTSEMVFYGEPICFPTSSPFAPCC
jgi:bacteriorhodopsin